MKDSFKAFTTGHIYMGFVLKNLKSAHIFALPLESICSVAISEPVLVW